jgi:hypothetical protein
LMLGIDGRNLRQESTVGIRGIRGDPAPCSALWIVGQVLAARIDGGKDLMGERFAPVGNGSGQNPAHEGKSCPQ